MAENHILIKAVTRSAKQALKSPSIVAADGSNAEIDSAFQNDSQA